MGAPGTIRAEHDVKGPFPKSTFSHTHINHQQQQQQHNPNHNNNNSNNNNTSSNNNNDSCSSGAGGAQAYLSLIQQYLAVFMVDNATFLAERCVAEYPDCAQAVYLQALCYYRAGKPQTARHILERFPAETTSTTTTSTTSSSSASSPSSSSSTASSMQYLAAQCSYELKEYTRAEDALLRETRTTFKQQVPQTMVNMDEWILQTSVGVI